MGFRHQVGHLLLTMVMGLSIAFGAESYEDRLAVTDRSNPDSLYQLVVWCRDNNYHTTANQHIREILALDANHAPTRELQGFVWDGRRWVHQSRLPADQRPQAGAQSQEPTLRRREASGPGPLATEITWDLTIPSAPAAEQRFRPFIASVMANMQKQDIFQMEGNWRTLIRPEHRNQSISQLAEGIVDGSYRDLWGPAMIATTLHAEGDDTSRAQARALLPFLVKASNASNNPDAQFAFAAVAAKIGEPKVIPHLIKMLESSQRDLQSAARQALSTFMLCREQDMNVAFARDWWARHHASSRATVLNESLSDPDPWIRLAAVRVLSDTDGNGWDARVMPVLFRLGRDDESRVVDAAGHELERLTGNNWGLNRHTAVADRQRISAQLQEWWQENRNGFVPVALRGRPSTSNPARDQLAQWVQQLADAQQAAAATTQLRRRGNEAIPALIRGMEANDGIIRNRARDILREISGQNFGFEGIRGNDQQRQQALAQWRKWAQEAGHLP